MKNKKDKKSKPQQKAESAVDAFVNGDSAKSDPQGSYTGRPMGNQAVPTQDSDDL